MSNYFEKLRLEGRKVDEGINKMSKIWSAPLIYIRKSYIKYNENEENTEILEEGSKANAAAEALSKSVAQLKESLFEDVQKSKKNLSEMKQFIEDSRTIYEDIKQQCDNIEILFIENGYVPEESEDITMMGEEKFNRLSIKEHSNNLNAESTPYLPWKSKLKTFDASTPEINGISKENQQPINKDQLVNDKELSITKKLPTNSINYMSYQQSPRQPVLSKYYYELLNNKEN